jgi:hypothetical protein
LFLINLNLFSSLFWSWMINKDAYLFSKWVLILESKMVLFLSLFCFVFVCFVLILNDKQRCLPVKSYDSWMENGFVSFFVLFCFQNFLQLHFLVHPWLLLEVAAFFKCTNNNRTFGYVKMGRDSGSNFWLHIYNYKNN